MAVIKKYNKENGTTYVYDSVSYWEKEKQQPRSKRKLIGKIDPITGEIVPTGGRGRKPKIDIPLSANPSDDAPVLSGGSQPSDVEDHVDYRRLYETSRRTLLERDAAIANMEATISRLTQEKQEMVAKLEQLVRECKR